MKKILNISLLTFFVSTVSYSAEYGIRASLEKTEHECSFQNPRVTSKVVDCGKEKKKIFSTKLSISRHVIQWIS